MNPLKSPHAWVLGPVMFGAAAMAVFLANVTGTRQVRGSRPRSAARPADEPDLARLRDTLLGAAQSHVTQLLGPPRAKMTAAASDTWYYPIGNAHRFAMAIQFDSAQRRPGRGIRAFPRVTLRIRILLGFGGLLAILLAVAALAGGVFARYSDTAQFMMRQDYDSVRASQMMIESLEEANATLEKSLLGDPADAAAAVNARFDEFSRGLRLQQRSINMADERAVTAALGRAWDAYRAAVPPVLDRAGPLALRRRIYNQQVAPAGNRVLSGAKKIMALNLRSLTDRQGNAQTLARRSRATLRALTLLGGLAAAAFAIAVGRRILRPLNELSASLRQVQAGNLDTTMVVASDDELGQLAAEFNEMACQLRTLRQIDHQRLLRTQRTTQLAIDSFPDPVVVLNSQGTVELTNQAARRNFGFVPGTAAASAARPWLAPALDTNPAADAAALPCSLGYDAALRVEHNGDERFLLPRIVPILDESAARIGTTVVLNDVTALRRLDQMKSGLLSLVSHELKTPLTSMRMILHLVAAEKLGPLNPQLRDLLITARDDSDRLHEIVETLLDLGRIEAGKALMDIKPVPLGPMLRSAADALGCAYAEAGVELQNELFPGAADALVLADAVRIGHVLNNLLINALRYTRPGGAVVLGAHAPGRDHTLACFVRDSGSGIPPQFLPRIFDRFFRVPGQSQQGGSGLGLAIAREIVEAHGGRITVESQEHRGSTFGFTLKLAPASASAAAPGI